MRHRLTIATVGTLTVLLLSPARAQDATLEAVPTGQEGADEQQQLGKLELEISPGARVAVSDGIDGGLLRLSLWHQDAALGTQIARASLPAILAFSAVPISRNAVRLDLRLAGEVKGVSVVRTAPDRLEVHFAEHRFAGHAVRLESRRAAADFDAEDNLSADESLTAILASPVMEAPTWVEWPPIIWPIGSTSPVQARLPLAPEPHPFGRIPQEVRRQWTASPTVGAAIQLADQGRLVEAARQLGGLPMKDDAFRATVALARGHVWSQPMPNGEPVEPGRAADAFLLAARMQPEASWHAWARGQSGYHFEREMRLPEAVRQYEAAIAAAPEHEDRAHWEVGLGLCRLRMRDSAEGVDRIAGALGGVSTVADQARFSARRAVAHTLWQDGEHGLAAAVVDLLLAEHPELARDAEHDLRWARLYFDAGRSAAALPFLERFEATATRRVDRDRARWWLHEAALVHRDSMTARKWLRTILDESPTSTLVPLARIRLEVLDALESGGKDPTLTWQQVALHMREAAMHWPHTPVEDEALSLTAQLFVELGLLEDSLSLLHWVEQRTPSTGGAVAYDHLVCQVAPRTFHELRGRGELTRALGIYRGYLDRPEMHGCVDVTTRTDAASTAMAAGLPGLASRWLGQAIAEGVGGSEEARNLVALADVYLAEGKVDSAQQTLEYLEDSDLPALPGLVAAAWGDVHLAQERWQEAERDFDEALGQVGSTVRTRSLAPSLIYRRGLAREGAGRHEAAAADLRSGASAGGAKDAVIGWLRVASAEIRVATSDEQLEAVLQACDSADTADVTGSQARPIAWYRSRALSGLERAEEAGTILADLATGTDSWGLLAREARAAAEFDAAVDGILKAGRD